MVAKKVSWAQKIEEVKQLYPSFERLDWMKAFDRDIELYGRVLRDLLKHEQAPAGQSGPRPGLDYDSAKRRLSQLFGLDYSIVPFKETFSDLCGGRSIRHVANKTGLNRNTVHRLLRGDIEPDAATIEIVAKAFNKQPSYFMEYRMGLILTVFMARMEQFPEISVEVYRKIWKEAK